MKERDVIGFIRRSFPGSGLGDDTAVIDLPSGRLLFASDAAVENVHFRLDYSTVGQAVQKVVTSNVSDIYAMGGEPTGIVFTAGLPEDCGRDRVESIVDGLERTCAAYDMKLFGGDTVLSPSGYFFDVAIIGFLPEGFDAFTRGGARPGDDLVLFGEVGGSRAGLWLLDNLAEEKPGGQLLDLLPPPVVRRSMLEAASSLSVDTTRADIEAMCAARLLPEGSPDVLELAAKHIVPLARVPSVNGSAQWAPRVHAMIDISDGLGRDLGTLCDESGVGAVVREDDIPVPQFLAGAMEDDRLKLTRFALSSGEEYVALAAVEAGDVPPGAVRIGTVTEDEALLIEDSGGRMRKLPRYGYEHSFGRDGGPGIDTEGNGEVQ